MLNIVRLSKHSIKFNCDFMVITPAIYLHVMLLLFTAVT